MRVRLFVFLVILGLVWALGGCAELKSKPVEKVSAPPTGNVCVWVLWAQNPSMLKKAQELLIKGEPFSLVSRKMVKMGGEKVRSNLDCMPSEEVDPILLKAVQGLQVGQVGGPIDIEKGQALVMLTTDKYRREGFRLYEQGLYAKAEAALLKDLELHPHSAEVWHLLAMCRSSQGKLKASMIAMDRALQLQPDSAAVMQDKATALVSMGRESEALELYENALELDPENPLVMSNYAWTLARMNRQLIKAETMAKKALEKNPRNPRYWNSLGMVFSAQRRHSYALACYYKTAALAPNFPNIDKKILDTVKSLSPAEVSRLGNMPLEMLQVAAADDPDADLTPTRSKPKKRVVKKYDKAPNKLAYILQVGSYRDHSEAKKQVRLWNQRGQKAFLEFYNSKKTGRWWRLMVGDYSSKTQARELADEFLQRKLINEYVLQVRKMAYVKDKLEEVSRSN